MTETIKIWIVYQQRKSQIPYKVKAFKDKGNAATDVAERMKAAPEGTQFWLGSTSMADETPA